MDMKNACRIINPLNTELNPICHLLALLGSATIVVVSRLRVKSRCNYAQRQLNCEKIKKNSLASNWNVKEEGGEKGI